jgi:hypothetical protein
MDFLLSMFGFNIEDMVVDKVEQGMKYSSKYLLCNIKQLLYEILDKYEKTEYIKKHPNHHYEKYKENFYNDLVKKGILVKNHYDSCTTFDKNKEKEFNTYINNLQENTKKAMIEAFKNMIDIQTNLLEINKKKAGKKIRNTIKKNKTKKRKQK